MSTMTSYKLNCREGAQVGVVEQAHMKVQILQRNLHHKGQNIIYYI